MDELFPQLSALVVTPWEAEEGPSLLMIAEINAAVDRACIEARKAPGPNEIPYSGWTIVHRANPGILNLVFNSQKCNE